MRLIFLLLIFFTSLHSEIIQIKKIDECLDRIQPDSLVIFDIDNTIIEPMQTLGSDQWFSYELGEYKKRGYSDREAFRITLAEYDALQNITKVKLVESAWVNVMEKLEKKQIPAIGLTMRGLALTSRTIEQLRSVKVDLSKASPVHREMILDDERGIIFRSGILFTAGTSKGSALSKLLKASGLHPKRILFIDDKQTYLQDVEKICLKKQIPFLGLRYGFLDEKVKSFSVELVKKQWEYFSQLLSDEEAQLLTTSDADSKAPATSSCQRVSCQEP